MNNTNSKPTLVEAAAAVNTKVSTAHFEWTESALRDNTFSIEADICMLADCDLANEAVMKAESVCPADLAIKFDLLCLMALDETAEGVAITDMLRSGKVAEALPLVVAKIEEFQDCFIEMEYARIVLAEAIRFAGGQVTFSEARR